jgi:cyclomaltodextrinase
MKKGVYSTVADWQDVIDLNYDNKQLGHAMTDALKYWVKEFDIDGYRCDVAGMVPQTFWESARASLDSIKPVFMLAEWDTPEVHTAFNMSYGWKMYSKFNEIHAGKAGREDLYKLFFDHIKSLPKDGIIMQFTSNHDEIPGMVQNLNDWVRLHQPLQHSHFYYPGCP